MTWSLMHCRLVSALRAVRRCVRTEFRGALLGAGLALHGAGQTLALEPIDDTDAGEMLRYSPGGGIYALDPPPGSRDAWSGVWSREFAGLFKEHCAACHGGLDLRNNRHSTWVNLSGPRYSRRPTSRISTACTRAAAATDKCTHNTRKVIE